jgi:SRSO17 transposase
MAERLGTDSQKLQQFITDSPWDEREVWRTIRREVVPVLEPLAAWIVDETGWLKQGRKSVGVSHQYCGAVGKQANCQVSVGVAVSDGRIAAPVAGRLYLPKSWTDDPERCAAAGVPAGTKFRIKPDIALDLLREVRDDGVTPAPVLGDEAYGTSAAFRRGVRQLGLEYFLNAGNDLSAWTKPVSIRQGKKLWTVASHQAPASSLEAISRSIPQKQWQSVSWRAADTGRCQTRIAYLPVYVHGDLDEHTGEWPETWLVVDWPAGRETPYHLFLAWLKTAPTAKRCLRLSRGRFAIEQFFQRDKTDLGLDHYEGRSWRGFHHHLVLAAIAYIFVLLIYLREKKLPM